MLAVLGESFYMVGHEKFHCFPLSKNIIEETFAKEGFQVLDQKLLTMERAVTEGICDATGLLFFRAKFDGHSPS